MTDKEADDIWDRLRQQAQTQKQKPLLLPESRLPQLAAVPLQWLLELLSLLGYSRGLAAASSQMVQFAIDDDCGRWLEAEAAAVEERERELLKQAV